MVIVQDWQKAEDSMKQQSKELVAKAQKIDELCSPLDISQRRKQNFLKDLGRIVRKIRATQ